MVDTKSNEATVEKWVESHGRVPGAYSKGIAGARDWQGPAIASEALWAQKVQEAAATKKRARKISEVSNEEWKRKAQEKGAARIATGMAASKDKFSSGMGKVLDVIRGTTIGARTADPMANIDNRVKPIAKALHDAFK